MRNIKYRGMSADKSVWFYGDYIKRETGQIYRDDKLEDDGVMHLIVDNDLIQEVNGLTVGQDTGLKDKNGKDIYTGDIVGYSTFNLKGVVKYDIKNGCLVVNINNGTTGRLTHKTINECKLKIIGNKYENPELLKYR